MPVEKVMRSTRNNMENYYDLQPIGQIMKPTLWAPSENLYFGLLRYFKDEKAYVYILCTSIYFVWLYLSLHQLSCTYVYPRIFDRFHGDFGFLLT